MIDGLLPRVYPIVDTAVLERSGCAPELFTEALVRGGARLIQFRHKGQFTRSVFETIERIAVVCDRAGAALIVNDRADLAAIFGAGLHLGQDDLPPQLARRIVPGAVIGYSTHNADQLAEAAGLAVDYLALGPIFGTTSKMNPDPLVGLDALRRLSTHLRAIEGPPLVAIGGITRSTATSVWQAGADCIAVIGDLIPDPCTPAAVQQRIEEWLALKN